ncbi:MAG: M23 family metallopeptidase [Candidatus Omnitrophica bacterium]|nr:M23 family metallopeptidase [Candidatus Omnitrophota bacterium]
MKRFLFCITLIVVTVFVTASLYQPVSIALFNIREPYFKSPIMNGSGELTIRSDSRGDGHYGAKRRNNRTHSGIDIAAPVGTPVYAAKSGIAFCGKVPTGYGKYVMIYHPDGSQTMYAHLSDWAVVSTQKIARGQVVGFVGKSGNAANKHIQPHLHFEIRKTGKPQNPMELMR